MAGFRFPSIFLLLKAVFDCCRPEFDIEVFVDVLSGLGVPFTIEVAMMAVSRHSSPTTGAELKLQYVSPKFSRKFCLSMWTGFINCVDTMHDAQKKVSRKKLKFKLVVKGFQPKLIWPVGCQIRSSTSGFMLCLESRWGVSQRKPLPDTLEW